MLNIHGIMGVPCYYRAPSKNNYNIVSILDNNPKLWGEKFYAFPIYEPIYIVNKIELNSNYLVIVCNPSDRVCRSIISQLNDFGIGNDNIVTFKPHWLFNSK